MDCCAIIHAYDDRIAQDTTGCCLPVGHPGPHEFVTAQGRRYQWETDFDCDCDHCKQADGDYCTTYWEVK